VIAPFPYGVAIGGLCVVSGRVKLLSFANYWYAALVVWNLAMILTAASKLS